MTTHTLTSRFVLHPDAACRQRVDDMPGMKSVSGHEWHWTIDGNLANVFVEADGTIRVALPVPGPMSRPAAMEANRDLPGNLRFAGPGGAMLVADTLLNGRAHLLRSFAELEVGMLLALGRNSQPIDGEALTDEQVSAAIAGGSWREGDVVELANGWELRPRVRGCATAVQATIEKTELWIFRRIIAELSTSTSYECLCAQALRFNEQLRHARLTVRDGALIAESRLHGEQITSTWIETAAWAVAVACRHTEDILCILAEDAQVADAYAAMFLGAKK
jgi:hypothetical protein